MLLDINRNLFGNAESPAVVTHMGMAHFAGTGPVGKTCGNCKHWKIIGEKAKAHVCAEARRLGARCNSPIPSDAAACKYFEQGAGVGK